jgi:hypothetical protein
MLEGYRINMPSSMTEFVGSPSDENVDVLSFPPTSLLATPPMMHAAAAIVVRQ